ncbi:xanthine dehydrogenase accessory factor [Nocardia tenerifensis]|uniref:Xanthine dehydrogenase accessory factor n=1 Tax=Nocardia tenerifensis TaxID=228006 RepID=A0A318K5X2_9NOCA|nr:XdhC/CoxI family protein [Nocardia tenerifensis]PXX65102.1 xanthine dehydrogenase accessory factor [Nocardia tenerifensis]
MRDIVDDLLRVWHSGRTGGLATIVRTMGSASLPVGSAMLVDPDGGVYGAVTDGGLEEIAYEAVLQAARTGRRAMHRYGAATGDSDRDATMDVFTEPFSRRHFPEFPLVAAEIAAHRRITVFTVVWHSDADLIGQHLVTDKKHGTELLALPDSDVFVASFAPPPRLIIFGANSFAAALTVQARLLGYRVTICDSRENFAKPEKFPGAEVVVDWPHRYLNTLSAAGEIDGGTGIVVTSHDPKFEIPLLTVALRLPELGYLGAMGSRTVHTQRMEDLRAGGFTEATLARLHSPAGLDLGARTATEMAVAIAAELIAARTEQSGRHAQHAAPQSALKTVVGMSN